MTLENLEYFLVAAEELNFTRAAERLYITQQSLSGHIRRGLASCNLAPQSTLSILIPQMA